MAASGIAAFCWFTSSRVRKSAKECAEEFAREHYSYPAQIVSNGDDFVQTALMQARWNTLAAAASCVAAFLQGVLLYLN